MSTLGDRLWAQYGGDAIPTTPQQWARDAIQRYGSGRAAGRALGVDEKTIRRWKNGETRHSDNVERLAEHAREEKAASRQGPLEVKFRYAGRDRDLKVGGGERQRLTAGAQARIDRAYARGDKEAMASAFVQGVTDPFYRRKLREAHGLDLAGAAGEGDAGVGSSSPAVFVS
jgi:hypothetical protein